MCCFRSIFAASTFGQASILEKMGWDGI